MKKKIGLLGPAFVAYGKAIAQIRSSIIPSMTATCLWRGVVLVLVRLSISLYGCCTFFFIWLVYVTHPNSDCLLPRRTGLFHLPRRTGLFHLPRRTGLFH